MSQAAMAHEFVAVPRDVLERLQAQAALSIRVNQARDLVVTEAKAAPSTAKSMIAPIGVGAIIALVATMDSVKTSETLKKNWWILPLALLAVGYIFRRRESPLANAILGAGAVLFVQAYQNRPKEEKTASTPPKTDTAGPTNSAVPTMHPIDDRTAWIQSGGQWVRVQLGAPVRPALPAQAEAAGPQVNDPAVALAAAAFAA
ncbi:MAG TPA: hypothetical protein PK156_34240 [Polyangium sp.]|nr:hypothetical protein [Polyangium sp.]